MSSPRPFSVLARLRLTLLVAAGLLAVSSVALADGYLQTNMVSDGVAPSTIVDKNLQNPWGIAFGPSSPFWIADNNDGLSTLYNTVGEPASLVVTIPPPMNGTGPAAPDGIVFNGTSEFSVTGPSGGSGPALFIFDTEDGTISGWNPGANLKNAILEVDQSTTGAVFKGLALAKVGGATFLYATDFRHGQVLVFDGTFNEVNSFTDPTVPSGFAPFGIRNIGNFLVVTFAKQDASAHDDVAGPGLGFVDLFTPKGVLVRRIASRGTLNAPWGIDVAPADFGRFSNDILIGNFGDGHISAFDSASGQFRGQLKNSSGATLVNPGLWTITFGNGDGAGETDILYFTAGPNNETDGVFGQIAAIP